MKGQLSIVILVVLVFILSTSKAEGGEDELVDERDLLTIEDVQDLENDIYIPSYNDGLVQGTDVGIDSHDHHILDQDDKHRPRGRKCHCLALSDSHNIGPYQAGVIVGLTTELINTGQVDYDVVSGISLGAFNAFIVSSTQVGEKPETLKKKLEDFWYAIADRNDELIRSWDWGMIYGFFYEQSLYDASHMYQFIESYFKDDEILRHLSVGITNVLNGQYKSILEHHGVAEMVEALKATIAFPGVFKSVEAFGSLWFSGSAVYEIDIVGPINHCKRMGYEDKDIVVDAILSGNPHLPHVMASFYNAFAMFERTSEVMDYYTKMYGLMRAQNGHPKVNFRYVIGPMRAMPNKIVPLRMTRKEVEDQLGLGHKDAHFYISEMKQRQTKELKKQKEEQAIQELLDLIGCTQACTPEQIAAQFASAVAELNGPATLNSEEFQELAKKAEAAAAERLGKETEGSSDELPEAAADEDGTGNRTEEDKARQRRILRGVQEDNRGHYVNSGNHRAFDRDIDRSQYPVHCWTKKRYMNPVRQAKHEKECGLPPEATMKHDL